MFNKLILCLAAVCLIHVAHCGPIDDLINELQPKIKKASVKVGKVVMESGKIIATTFGSIQKEISTHDKALDVQTQQLHEAIKQAEADAQTAGKDIGVCLEQERAAEKHINRKNLELCRISDDLNLLAYKIGEVTKSQVILSDAPKVCVKKSGVDLGKIRSCIEDAIDTVSTKADEVGNQISPRADEAEAKALDCANKNAADLQAAIKTVADNFNDCVSKV